MKAILIVHLFPLIFWSCNSKEKNFRQELNGENLIKLELINLNISMKVSQTHSIVKLGDKSIINLNPDRRTVKQFSIAKSRPVVEKGKYVKIFLFDNGTILKYYVFEEDGGSGGIEYKLEGILEYGKELYLITATDQKELEEGDPEFCLKYLSTIKSLKQFANKK